MLLVHSFVSAGEIDNLDWLKVALHIGPYRMFASSYFHLRTESNPVFKKFTFSSLAYSPHSLTSASFRMIVNTDLFAAFYLHLLTQINFRKFQDLQTLSNPNCNQLLLWTP